LKFGKLRIGFVIGLACFLLLGIWVIATPCPRNLGSIETPLYIERVWPPSESETWLGCYIRRYILPPSGIGVGVAVDMDSIWELEVPQSNKLDLPSFPNRVSLYVDEQQVPITQRLEGGGAYFIGDTELDVAGWYFFGSHQFTPPGEHLAKVVIATRSGKILEYEWRFRIK